VVALLLAALLPHLKAADASRMTLSPT
jgi:hypothetical protein